MTPTLAQLAADLAAGRTTSEQLVDECLARIADPAGEGARACVSVDGDGARRTARSIDARRSAGAKLLPFAGIPVTVKDLFDVCGQVTRAGSRALDRPPAARDASVVARWREAGLVIVARTNMTEFAFSALGINPHHGTPLNPWDRAAGRIPGGSSSGAAVSVADGMAHGALGSDTGGSCRIPAAMSGIVGFKPTQARVPRDGIVALSTTLDAVGVLGRTVGCCAVLDAIAAGEEPITRVPLQRPPRLALPRNYLHADADPEPAAAFDRAVERLRAHGAELVEGEWPELDAIPEMNAAGGFAAGESWRWHRELIAARAADYDPRVLVRIRRGETMTDDDLARLRQRRAALIEGVRRRLKGFDAFLCPTVPIIAPRLEALADDNEYARLNLLALRNPAVVNLLDGCAISLPMHVDGEPPTGLMVAGLSGQDATIIRIATWIEERL